MSRLLHRLGTPHENWDVPGAQAQKGIELLREHTPGSGNASARVVVHTRDGSPVGATTLAPLTERLATMDHAVAVSPPSAQRSACSGRSVCPGDATAYLATTELARDRQGREPCFQRRG